MFIPLCAVCVSFQGKMAELSSSNRDCKVCKAENVY